MSTLRHKLHFLTARARSWVSRKTGRSKVLSYIWRGGEPFEESAATRVGLRHGSADVMKLSDLRDRCRPITVGNTTERCHTWSVSYKTDQKQHIYLKVISYRGVVKKNGLFTARLTVRVWFWSGCCDFFQNKLKYFDLFYHFTMGKIGPTFSHFLTVRAEGADPSPPLTFSLTVKYPFFTASLYDWS